MTVEIEKLKALALAATKGPWQRSERLTGPFWHISSDHTIGGEPCKSGRQAIAAVHGESKRGATAYAAMFEANASFIAAANPAAVLELIAEVERLRAELAAGAARQGGGTSEMAGAGLAPKGAETRMDTSSCAGAGPAPAAGTEKDAERYRLLGDGEIIEMADEFQSYDGTCWHQVRVWGRPPGSWVGTPFDSGRFQPTRRKVTSKTAPARDSATETMDHAQLQALGQHQEKP